MTAATPSRGPAGPATAAPPDITARSTPTATASTALGRHGRARPAADAMSRSVTIIPRLDRRWSAGQGRRTLDDRALPESPRGYRRAARTALTAWARPW